MNRTVGARDVGGKQGPTSTGEEKSYSAAPHRDREILAPIEENNDVAERKAKVKVFCVS